jgi:ADP-ribose pyrophosphatase
METLFDGFGWKVTMEEASLPDGRVKKVARVKRADSAHIIAVLPSGNILVLREFRPYYGEYIWMLPSGRVDKETDALAGAQRELQEETGYRAEKLEHLWTLNHSESLIMANHVYVAEQLIKDPLPHDEDELIEVHELSPEEALKRIESSPKVHLPSAYALRRFIDGGSTGSP